MLSLDEVATLIQHNKSSISRYIQKGVLPKPVYEGNKLFIDKDKLEKKLKVSLDEPLLLIDEVYVLTGISMSTIRNLCLKDKFPHLRLSNKRGSKLLFVRNETEEYMKFKLTWYTGFHDRIEKLEFFQDLFKKVFLNEQSRFSRQDEVLYLVLFENNTFDEISEKFDLTSERVRQIFQKGLRYVIYKMRRFDERMLQYKEYCEKVRLQGQIINKLEQKLLQYQSKEETDKSKQGLGDDKIKVLSKSLLELDVSVRLSNCIRAVILRYYGIRSLGNISLGHIASFPRHEYLGMRNFGSKSMNELDELLEKYDIAYSDVMPIQPRK